MAELYLEAQNVAVGYAGKPVLEQLSFGVKRGEILALIGPNGAGKSTLLKSIARQLPLLNGNLLLDGQKMEQYSGKTLSQKMAVVFTEPLHTERMTCQEVVEAGRYPYTGHFGVLSKQDKQAVKEAMELVQIEELGNQEFTRISDGQRQRVLLARAVCQEPELIVLDEPVTFLDIRYQLEFLQVLQALVQQKKLAVVMSLHDLSLVKGVANQVLCVGQKKNQGRFGTPEEVLHTTYLQELFEINGELKEYGEKIGILL